jgi:deoxyhypusine monooxygenase
MASVLANHFNIREVDAASCPAGGQPAHAKDGAEEAAAAAASPMLSELRACLCGPCGPADAEPEEEEGPAVREAVPPSQPVAKVMRAIYYLRTMGGDAAVDVLCNALRLRTRHSPLLRHEIGYVLGQMQSPRACGALEAVLVDATDDVMVRHECAEALGAIGAARSVPLLDRMADRASMVEVGSLAPTANTDGTGSRSNSNSNSNNRSPFQATAVATHEPPEELRETCEIARDFCKWKAGGSEGSAPAMACACMLSPYSTYDPAPPSPETDALSTQELGDLLGDPSVKLFERYRAMFALRNRGGEACVLQLGRALVEDETSALLRHEVAYVLGQMQHPAAIDPLAESLRRTAEHSMVRHEAAEALGAIEGDGAEMERCFALMREFSDPEREANQCVRESCEVALDAADYWRAYSA